MQGCFAVVILLALVAYIGGQGASVEGLGGGFVVGAIVGLLFTVLGGWSLGWNSHVDYVEDRDHTKARETAQRDRR